MRICTGSIRSRPRRITGNISGRGSILPPPPTCTPLSMSFVSVIIASYSSALRPTKPKKPSTSSTWATSPTSSSGSMKIWSQKKTIHTGSGLKFPFRLSTKKWNPSKNFSWGVVRDLPLIKFKSFSKVCSSKKRQKWKKMLSCLPIKWYFDTFIPLIFITIHSNFLYFFLAAYGLNNILAL